MDPDASPQNTRLTRRKIRDRSMAHVLAGIALLLPPVVGAAAMDAKLGGIPVPLLYVFGVWLLLILVALLLAGPLSRTDEFAAPAETADSDT